MSLERRRIIRISEKALSTSEMLARRKSTLQIVESVCQCNHEIDISEVILFGSLARMKSYSGSDVDIAFLSENSLIDNINVYLGEYAKISSTVNKFKESLNVTGFVISPVLILRKWMDKQENFQHIIPAVLEAVKNEGIPIWLK